jgi:two-component system, cell cycle sensor histidine kinase and response regulator CckA
MMVVLVWIHVLAIPFVAVATGSGPIHGLFEASIVALGGVVATMKSPSRSVRMAGATFGLISASAVLVHLSGGLIEMHFHFFVMVAVVTLYQAWLPFLLAIGYVVVHHGVMGVVDPASVFNHPAALLHPWKWAAVHGFFISGASAAGLAAWRLNEDARERLTRTYVNQLELDKMHINEQEEAKEALKRSEERFKALVQNSYDVVSVADENSKIQYISPSIMRILGIDAEDFVGKIGFDFVHPDDVEKATAHHKLAGETVDDTIALEIRARHADGTWRWLEITSHNQLDNPAINGIVTHVRDITDRKEAEATSKLLEDQLRQSQKLEAVGQLAGGVAHDFNNLLSVIQNYAKFVLQDMAGDDPNREDMGEIVTASERAANLTRQLLTFSRKDVVRPEEWELNEIVSDMGKMLNRTIPENINIGLRLSSRSGHVLIDRGQLEQVIMNIAVNARDAMPNGGDFTIATSDVEIEDNFPVTDMAPGHYVRLSMIDSGCGMDQQTSSRVFEPFFTTKARGSGTGLGLATVYGIVQHSGGQISVTSGEGIGTRFDIYLPRCEVSTPTEKTPAEETSHAAGGERILVAEDEVGVRGIVERILTHAGYDVLVAASGEEAFDIAMRHDGTIDLLLTDMVMPQMSGTELSSKLPNVPVVFMSGYSEDMVSGSSEELPTAEDEYVQKPFSPETILGAIRNVLDKNRVATTR